MSCVISISQQKLQSDGGTSNDAGRVSGSRAYRSLAPRESLLFISGSSRSLSIVKRLPNDLVTLVLIADVNWE